MITRKQLMDITDEAQHNPRAARYLVRQLTAPQPYPMRTGEDAMPAIVAQFAVEHPEDTRAWRVISIAVSHAGYAIWCGDKFTQGDITPLEASLRTGLALDGIPHAYREGARKAMMALYGAYPHRAPCHFWDAWHSHQGVCKHVAAALQYAERSRRAGLEGLLIEMDEMLYALTTAPLLSLLTPPEALQAAPENAGTAPAPQAAQAEPTGEQAAADHPAAPGTPAAAAAPDLLPPLAGVAQPLLQPPLGAWSWNSWWQQLSRKPGDPG